tara:strand:+ start:1553 stop:3205 length:1653 start_codon:yes stop_codon:yes gene_type:complete
MNKEDKKIIEALRTRFSDLNDMIITQKDKQDLPEFAQEFLETGDCTDSISKLLSVPKDELLRYYTPKTGMQLAEIDPSQRPILVEYVLKEYKWYSVNKTEIRPRLRSILFDMAACFDPETRDSIEKGIRKADKDFRDGKLASFKGMSIASAEHRFKFKTALIRNFTKELIKRNKALGYGIPKSGWRQIFSRFSENQSYTLWYWIPSKAEFFPLSKMKAYYWEEVESEVGDKGQRLRGMFDIRGGVLSPRGIYFNTSDPLRGALLLPTKISPTVREEMNPNNWISSRLKSYLLERYNLVGSPQIINGLFSPNIKKNTVYTVWQYSFISDKYLDVTKEYAAHAWMKKGSAIERNDVNEEIFKFNHKVKSIDEGVKRFILPEGEDPKEKRKPKKFFKYSEKQYPFKWISIEISFKIIGEDPKVPFYLQTVTLPKGKDNPFVGVIDPLERGLIIYRPTGSIVGQVGAIKKHLKELTVLLNDANRYHLKGLDNYDTRSLHRGLSFDISARNRYQRDLISKWQKALQRDFMSHRFDFGRSTFAGLTQEQTRKGWKG